MRADEHQHGGACQFGHRVVLPAARLLIGEQPRQTLDKREQAEDHELGQRACVYSPGAGDLHPVLLVGAQPGGVDLLTDPSGRRCTQRNRLLVRIASASPRDESPGMPNNTSASASIASQTCSCSTVRLNESTPRWSHRKCSGGSSSGS